MTVEQLIERLRQMPPHYEVRMDGCCHGGCSQGIKDVATSGEGEDAYADLVIDDS